MSEKIPILKDFTEPTDESTVAINIYDELVGSGKIKSIMAIPEGDPQKLEQTIQNAWEILKKELKERSIEPTENLAELFRAQMDDAWGVEHLGPGY